MNDNDLVDALVNAAARFGRSNSGIYISATADLDRSEVRRLRDLLKERTAELLRRASAAEERADLAQTEAATLRKIIVGLTDRVAAQSELLSRRAEGTADG